MNMATILSKIFFFHPEINNTDITESKKKKQSDYLKLEYLDISTAQTGLQSV
jgi:hypothetical protein